MAWLETTFLIQTPLQTRTDRGEKVESNEREPKDGWVFGNEPWANKCQALVNQTDEATRRRGQGVLGLSHKQRFEHEQTMESVRIVQSIEMDTLVNRDGLLGRVRRVKGAMAVRLFDALIQMGGWYTNVIPPKKRRRRGLSPTSWKKSTCIQLNLREVVRLRRH